MRRAIAVLCLLALALVPIGQSSGGVISSIQVTGNNLVGEGPIDLNITLTGVGGASSASVTWNASLTDIEGNLIDSDSGFVGFPHLRVLPCHILLRLRLEEGELLG